VRDAAGPARRLHSRAASTRLVLPRTAGSRGGYGGGAVWQPPAIDTIRGQLYVGTGNNQSAPASVRSVNW